MNAMKLSTKQASPIVKATFPEYNGRKFRLEFTESVTFYDTNWSGGTRNQYKAVKRDGTIGVQHIPAPWVNMVEGKKFELSPDVLVVEHSHFCGQDMGIRIYAHPSNAPKWIA